MEQTSTITLLVNGEQAENSLDAMNRKAEELAASIRQAQLAGDKLTMRRLQKEFDALIKQIEGVESSLAGVINVMNEMAMQSERSSGIKGVFNRLGELTALKMPSWFSQDFPDFNQYLPGLNSMDFTTLYNQLMELSETYKDGSGTIKIDLRNGKTIELSSLKDIKSMMERLLKMIEVEKRLKAQYEDEQNPQKRRISYKYTAEDEWRRGKDSENYIAMATGQKDYQQYLLDRTRIEMDYLKKKIANWRSTDTEIQQFERQLSVLQQKELTQQNKQMRMEETRHNREKREQITVEHEKTLAELEELNKQGKLSYRAYKEAVLREDVDYLQKIKIFYSDNTYQRYDIERKLLTRLQKMREQKAWELQEAETAIRNKYYKDREIRNREDIEHEYGVRNQALTIMYQNMVEQANGNVKQIEKITKQYHKVMRKEEIAMKRALGEEVTLTWQEKIEEFYEWLKGDEGKKWQTLIGDFSASMSAIFSSVSEMAKIESEIAIARIEKRYEREISLAEGNQYKVKHLERKREREIANEKKQAAEKTFGFQVLQAIATTASNAIKAYGDALEVGGMAGLILAPIAAGMATAAGMVQIALINKQKQAAGAIGYRDGGFTRKGNPNSVVGVVHAGEWVASKRLVDNPVFSPAIEMLERAQRNNYLPSLTKEYVDRNLDVTHSKYGSDLFFEFARQEERNANMNAQLQVCIDRLTERLKEPFVTINTVTGDMGIKEAQDEYQRLMNNTLPKRLRKNL